MSLKPVLVVLVLAGIGFGVYVYLNRPVELPNIVVKDLAGDPVSLEDMRGDKENLLVVFLNPGCGYSKASLGIVKAQLDQHPDAIAVAGLTFGTQKEASRLAEKENIEFAVYGMRDSPDVFSVNELIESVGFTRGGKAYVWGGTILVVDSQGKLRFKLEKEEVRELPERLSELAY